MTINEAKEHLKKIFLDRNLVPFLWGAPGIGKSTLVAQIAEEYHWNLIDLRLSLLNPVDLRGLPYLDANRHEAVWLKPEFLPTEGQGILFLDELNIAPTSTQQAAYQLILDKRLGNYVFPETWRIVAAGNREQDGAQINRMPSPLANRLIHFNLTASLDDWKAWAQTKLDGRVVGFLNFRPQLLSMQPKAEEKAYPTPRSWFFVSQILKLYNDTASCFDVLAGAVGEGVAKEFIAFLDIYSALPDIQAILEGKDSSVPSRPDVLYALSSALVARLKDEYLENFLKYTLKMAPEMAVLTVRDAARAGWQDKILQKPDLWEQWNDKFGNLL